MSMQSGRTDVQTEGNVSGIKKITEFLENNDTVFKQAQVLSEKYIPDNFLFREEEIRQIIHNLTAFFEDVPPNNMFLVGSPSTGKTHILLYLTGVLNDYAVKEGRKIKYVYVNVGGKTLPQSLVNIAEKMGLNAVKNFGLGTFDMIVKNIDGCYFFIFDEFDRIKKTPDYTNPYDIIVNLFSRIGSNVRLTLVANNVKIIEKLEAPTKSSFSPNQLYFRSYNAFETTEILKDRCKKAFIDGVIDEETIAKFGAWIYRSGVDLRTSFKILLNAGRNVSVGNTGDLEKKITFDVLMKSFKDVEKNILQEILSKLNDSELLLIHSIASAQKKYNKTEVEKNIVYKTYQTLCNSFAISPLTWRHISSYITPKIEMQGIIRTDVHGRGKGKGTATFFSLDCGDLNEILKTTSYEIKRRMSDEDTSKVLGVNYVAG